MIVGMSEPAPASFDPLTAGTAGISLPGEPGNVAPVPDTSHARSVGSGFRAAGRRRLEMASIGSRWKAMVVDSFAAAIVPAIILVFGLIKIPTNDAMCQTVDPYTGATRDYVCPTPETGPFMALLGMVILVAVLAQFVAVIGPIGSTGQSVGMRGQRIRVLDDQTLLPIGIGRSIGRSVAASLVSGWFNLGYLWAFVDGRNQTWHDKLVGSIVVRD